MTELETKPKTEPCKKRDDLFLKAFYPNGKNPLDLIAETLGWSREAVVARARALGLRRGSSTSNVRLVPPPPGAIKAIVDPRCKTGARIEAWKRQGHDDETIRRWLKIPLCDVAEYGLTCPQGPEEEPGHGG